jgi:hypothetical protein
MEQQLTLAVATAAWFDDVAAAGQSGNDHCCNDDLSFACTSSPNVH